MFDIGKVNVGLASHWPCVTDNSGISTYRLTALDREMSTPPVAIYVSYVRFLFVVFVFSFRLRDFSAIISNCTRD